MENAGRRIGQDDYVVDGGKIAALNAGVIDRVVAEFVTFQEPTGPTFVGHGHKALIDADARPAEQAVGVERSGRGREVHA